MQSAEYSKKLAEAQMLYADNAREATKHRAQGHNMSISTIEALVPKGDIVSFDCECGQSFAMPFVNRNVSDV